MVVVVMVVLVVVRILIIFLKLEYYLTSFLDITILTKLQI